MVIGGGYAGTIAANRLRMRADVDITLVDPRPTFVERIRLHQWVARTGDATTDYGTLLGDGIELVVDSATLIDTAARRVRMASGRSLDYDYVVYAVGSTGTTPPSVPGAAAFAVPLAEFEDAERLRAKLEELPRDAPVTVVGGGLTGIETAAELAEQGRAVTLVCGRTLAPTFSAAGRRYIATWLSRHRVVVLEGASVSEVRQDAVVLDDGPTDGPADGAVRPSALTIWAAGFGVPDLAVASGLRTDPRRRRFEPVDAAESVRITEQFMTAATTVTWRACSRCSRRTPPGPRTAAARPRRRADRCPARRRWPRSC
ncbi:hypothetical protein GCM10010252_72960 [Streptomyces aureoverticillatus]|nr:hypothetical protein GCM10010252_72960 [Streptomyces aureoverticillatus]